jgi:hypothetical protein
MRSLGATKRGPPRTWRATIVTAAVEAPVSRNLRRLTETGFCTTDLLEMDDEAQGGTCERRVDADGNGSERRLDLGERDAPDHVVRISRPPRA